MTRSSALVLAVTAEMEVVTSRAVNGVAGTGIANSGKLNCGKEKTRLSVLVLAAIAAAVTTTAQPDMEWHRNSGELDTGEGEDTIVGIGTGRRRLGEPWRRSWRNWDWYR